MISYKPSLVPGEGGGKILWIDDDLASDDPLIRLLELAGYSVDCAATADAGLDLALRNPYAIVLLDLRLPDRPGLFVLDSLKFRRPDLPVVIVSGYADLFDEALVHKYGAIEIRANPVTDDDLLGVIRKATLAKPGALELYSALSECRHLTADGSSHGIPTGCAVRCSNHRQHLLHLLLQAVALPDLSVRAFMTRAEALRACGAIQGRRKWNVPAIVNAIEAAVRPLPAVSQAVADALSAVHSSRTTSTDRGTRRAALGRLVRAESGRSLGQWRVANRVRLATCDIAHSDEQIAQIAYHVGYAVPPQLNRDFRPILGACPGAFRRAYRALVAAYLGLGVLTVPGCSGGGSPVEPALPNRNFSVTGSISDRLSRSAVGGSAISFSGPVTGSARVTSTGAYELRGLAAGDYTVVISGPTHVPHETRQVSLIGPVDLPFSVVTWGATPFGTAYDETFQKFFHQLARVGRGTGALRKWVIPPTELYLVEGTVPREQFDIVSAELRRVNEESLPALWCHWTGPLTITIGPDSPATVDGRIIVRPNWNDGATGSLGDAEVRWGRVAVNVFGPTANRLLRADEIRAILGHELFHVAGAFHVCGGNVGENPFGFSRTNCPFPDSLMANLGTLVPAPSPQDRLASCLIYHPETAPGNLYPDINPIYPRR